MTDRPIIFSGPMVRALIEGRKTQTRRVLHVQPPAWVNYCEQPQMFNVLHQWVPSGLWRWAELDESGHLALRQWPLDEDGLHYWIRPRFSVRDRLWVRETWTARMTGGWTIADARSRMFQNELFYAADGKNSIDGWWPSIHMPREFSRLTLVVTDVRVERLQDISEADAIDEGPGFVGKVTREVCESATAHRLGIGPRWRNARDWYADLWDHLNAKRGYGWDANPWIVAVTFAVHHENIDRMVRP